MTRPPTRRLSARRRYGPGSSKGTYGCTAIILAGTIEMLEKVTSNSYYEISVDAQKNRIYLTIKVVLDLPVLSKRTLDQQLKVAVAQTPHCLDQLRVDARQRLDHLAAAHRVALQQPEF